MNFEENAASVLEPYVKATVSGQPQHGRQFYFARRLRLLQRHRFSPRYGPLHGSGWRLESKDDNPRNDGSGGPGYTIKCECDRPDTRTHFAGSLSMAHAEKNTRGFQFFITHLSTDHLNGSHTVFGRVLDGLPVARLTRQ